MNGTNALAYFVSPSASKKKKQKKYSKCTKTKICKTIRWRWPWPPSQPPCSRLAWPARIWWKRLWCTRCICAGGPPPALVRKGLRELGHLVFPDLVVDVVAEVCQRRDDQSRVCLLRTAQGLSQLHSINGANEGWVLDGGVGFSLLENGKVAMHIRIS